MGKFIDLLLKFSQKRRSVFFRVIMLLSGGTVFLVIVPLVLAGLGRILSGIIGINLPRYVEVIISIVFTGSGLFFCAWTVASQWLVGKGTPVPIAPTQKLIVVGPYRLCRNPLQLGVVLYYLGIVTFLGSLTAGLFAFLAALIIGSLYHKFVEEKELLLRFGEDYKSYRTRTPFIFPRIRRRT
jgi:protein-S-isoprenylcysteine O-methyltransferase Ste14